MSQPNNTQYPMFGLVSGVISDIVIAFLIVREYEKMES
jgi:hypothetical protein